MKYLISLISESNGKLSISRLLALLAFLFACIITILNKDQSLVFAFLSFSGGLKIGSKFGENKGQLK